MKLDPCLNLMSNSWTSFLAGAIISSAVSILIFAAENPRTSTLPAMIDEKRAASEPPRLPLG